MKPERIADYENLLGEGPIWHALQKKLYWVDIDRGRLFCYDPAIGRHEIVFEGQQKIGGLTVQADGRLVLYMVAGKICLFDEGRLIELMEIPEEADSRFNDVAADPEGRVFAGTMSTTTRPGRLWRIDPDRSYHLILDDCGTPNGMGFTLDERQMYFTDSCNARHWIVRFQYDRQTGAITDPKPFFQSDLAHGKPDGLTVDAEGHVWTAQWNGGRVIRLKPDGTEDFAIRLPAKKVSSVTFGGDDLTDLFLTTAGGDHRDEEGDGAGALFRVRAGIQGRTEYLSRIGL